MVPPKKVKAAKPDGNEPSTREEARQVPEVIVTGAIRIFVDADRHIVPAPFRPAPQRRQDHGPEPLSYAKPSTCEGRAVYRRHCNGDPARPDVKTDGLGGAPVQQAEEGGVPRDRHEEHGQRDRCGDPEGVPTL